MAGQLQDYDEIKQQQETETRLQAGNALNIKAERAARVLNLQGRTGLPREVIDGDLDYIEEKSRQKEFDPAKYRKTNPKFAKFAADNPFHLSVLQDDEESMTRTEWVMDALFDWSAVGMANKSSFAQQEMAFIGDRQRRGDIREGDDEKLKELEKYVVDHDFDTSGFKSLVVAGVKQGANMVGAYKEGLETAKYTAPAGALYGAVAGGGVFSAPGTVAGYGAGFTAGMIGGGFKYSEKLEGGLAYLEYRDLGFSHSDAVWAADIAGNINGLLEAVGGQIIFNKLPGARSLTGNVGDEIVKQLLGRTTFRQVAGKAVKDWGIGVSGEVVTEITQEAMTIVMGEILKAQNDRPDEMLTGDQWTDRIAAIALETIKSTVLLAGMGPGQRLIMDGRRARNARLMQQAFEALGDTSKESKLRKNVKGKYREFVDALTEDGALKNILISADRFDTYFQGKGLDPDEMAKELNVKNIDEARELGHKVKIPIGDYAEKIAPTEHHSGLSPDITTKEGEMSGRQGAEFEANKAALEAEIEKLAEPASTEKMQAQQKIIDDVTTQLIAAGTEQSAAKTQAQVMVGFINLAERMGMDPNALYERMFAGVRRSLPEGMGFEDVDILVDPLIDRLRSGDFPSQMEMRGQSLLEMIKEKGGLTDEGGELAARDFGDLINKGTGKSRGDSLDGMAEAAHEAGFIAERDPELLLQAIEREKAGEPVFGFDSPGDPVLRALGEKLDELASFIGAENIDLDILTNAEVRQLLEGGEKFSQIDTTELDRLIDSLLRTEEHDPAMLSRAAMLMPRIFQQQDFGKTEITDTFRVEGSTELAEVTEVVQKSFDRSLTRRNILRKLLDCVSG